MEKRMTKTALKKMLLMTSVIGAIVINSAHAADYTFSDKTAFGDAVKEYILENPEVILESIDLHRAKQIRRAYRISHRSRSSIRG
jgi:hypothetical protein